MLGLPKPVQLVYFDRAHRLFSLYESPECRYC